MKKALSILLAVLMVVSMAACASDSTAPTTAAPAALESTAAATEAATEPTPVYGVDRLTIGTTASIETAVFGEYNFDMLASGELCMD